MAWYRSGTISLTNGSAAVTGAGTAWILNASVGEALLAPDGKLYEISAIASDTSITLATAYLGATQAGQAYVLVPTQSYIRDLAAQAAALVNTYSSIANNAGAGKFGDGTVAAPGVTFAGDQDTGFFRSANNEVTFVANGVAQFKYSATGGVQFLSTSVDINGGTIDGTVVGGAAPAAGNFTTLSASGQIYSAANIAAVGEVTGMTVRASIASLITDWNAAVTSGDFMAFEGANAPTPYGWYIGRATAHNTGYVTQEVWLFTADNPVRFRRHSLEGVWSAWVHAGEWSSSGLAIAGSLSTSGIANINSPIHTGFALNINAGSAGNPAVGVGSVSDDPVLHLERWDGGVNFNAFRLRSKNVSGGALSFELGTGTGRAAQTFSEKLLLNGSGLAVTGVVTAKGATSIDANAAFESNALASGLTAYHAQNNGGYGAFFGYDNIRYSGGAAMVRNIANTPLVFETNNTECGRFDQNGHLGLGVVPSAWGAGRNIETGRIGNFVYGATGASTLAIGANAYQNDGWKYANSSSAAGMYDITGNVHSWYTAPSGTAGDPISFVQDMALQNGHLGLGVTPGAVGDGREFQLAADPSGGVSALGTKTGAMGQAITYLSTNTRNTGFFTDVYRVNGSAIKYEQSLHGVVGHRWFSAPAGNAGDPISFTQAMTLDASGNLIAGATSTPGGHKFSRSVYQTVMFESLYNTTGARSIYSTLGTNANDASSYHLICETEGANKLLIYGNGNVLNANNSYGSLSDIKLKENITDAPSYWDRYKRVQWRKYNLKADPSHSQLGVVAQELEEVFPGLIEESDDYEIVEKMREVDVPAVTEPRLVSEAVFNDDGEEIEPAVYETVEVSPATTRLEPYTEQVATGEKTKSVKYSVLGHISDVVLQEAMVRIETLEAENTRLKAQMSAVLARLDSLEAAQ